jgi:hypothetical protein
LRRILRLRVFDNRVLRRILRLRVFENRVLRRILRLRVFENRVLRRILDRTVIKWQEGRENCVIKSFINRIFRQV